MELHRLAFVLTLPAKALLDMRPASALFTLPVIKFASLLFPLPVVPQLQT
jgi:hypothetical protein